MTEATTAPHTAIQDVDPATGEVLATIPCADRNEVSAAVERARAAQPAWAALGIEGRVKLLKEAADRFEDEALTEKLAGLITAEMGKPLADARREAGSQAASIRRLADAAAEALQPTETREGDTVTCLSREALGVVGAITPWNFPLGMARELIVPALVAGNTVVFKPSELVPLCGAGMHEELAAVLPEDVVVLVQGAEDTGKALVAAPIDMVGFVGSVSAGRHIMAACAKDLKRMVLELGGKDPMIVCADADLEAAADFAVRESMRNTGQVCCSVERIYVEREAAEAFTDLVVERAAKCTSGDGRDEVFMGPMASEDFRAAVLRQLEDAKTRGARVLVGGEAPEGPGNFLPATVVTDVDESMALMTEETFGPVATIRPVDDAEQAVALANASEFGLGASVWAGDAARGRALATRLQAGQVGVNRGLGGAGDPPWAGVKSSGFGFLGSPDGYRQFSRPLSVSWNDPK
jgi:acyl-CoA reductase-like NAD-dependent aldehyde dehydrogenase